MFELRVQTLALDDPVSRKALAAAIVIAVP